MRSRESAISGWPTAANMRLTWWNLPSVSSTSATDRSSPERSTVSLAGRAVKSDNSMPAAKARTSSPVSRPAHSARYSFPAFHLGEISRWASWPSSVSSTSPVTSRSSRPTGPRPRRRSASGSRSSTVLRRRSSVAVTTPAGLFTMMYCGPASTGPAPSTLTRPGSTFMAGSAATAPSTRTRPAAMAFLASLRVSPASATALSSRTPGRLPVFFQIFPILARRARYVFPRSPSKHFGILSRLISAM